MRIHWLQHVPFEGLGSIADWAVAHGCPITGSRLFAGEELPSVDAFDMLVIMGGPMSVHDERSHPWLTSTIRGIPGPMASRMALTRATSSVGWRAPSLMWNER